MPKSRLFLLRVLPLLIAMPAVLAQADAVIPPKYEPGETTGGAQALGEAKIEGLTARYRIDTLLGEVTYIANYKWTGTGKLPANPTLVLECVAPGVATHYYLHNSPAAPESGNGKAWSFDTTGSPNWNQVFHTGKAIDSPCLGAKEAKAFYLAKFSVVGASLAADIKGLKATEEAAKRKADAAKESEAAADKARQARREAQEEAKQTAERRQAAAEAKQREYAQEAARERAERTERAERAERAEARARAEESAKSNRDEERETERRRNLESAASNLKALEDNRKETEDKLKALGEAMTRNKDSDSSPPSKSFEELQRERDLKAAEERHEADMKFLEMMRKKQQK